MTAWARHGSLSRIHWDSVGPQHYLANLPKTETGNHLQNVRGKIKMKVNGIHVTERQNSDLSGSEVDRKSGKGSMEESSRCVTVSFNCRLDIA